MKLDELRPVDTAGQQQMQREVRHALQQVRKGAARSWMVTPLPDRTPASHVFFSTTVHAAVQHWMAHLQEMSGPFEFGPPPWSLTHSGEWGAFAAGRNAIGIDIEVDRDLMNPRRLWDRIAHHSEHEPAKRYLDPNPLQGLWTAKEAVSKGMGLGITMDFRDMRWEPNGRGAVVLVEQADAPPRRWDIEQIRGPGYWLAVATEVDPPSQIGRFLRDSD